MTDPRETITRLRDHMQRDLEFYEGQIATLNPDVFPHVIADHRSRAALCRGYIARANGLIAELDALLRASRAPQTVDEAMAEIRTWKMTPEELAAIDGPAAPRDAEDKPCPTFSEGEGRDECKHCGWTETAHVARDAEDAPKRKLAPKDWTCLTCGHAHCFEADEGGFDSAEDIPWGKCKTCDCKAPNYREAKGDAEDARPLDPQEKVTTYTPMFWATMTPDEQYAEYARVRELLTRRIEEFLAPSRQEAAPTPETPAPVDTE